jgi:hypothetical protein
MQVWPVGDPIGQALLLDAYTGHGARLAALLGDR